MIKFVIIYLVASAMPYTANAAILNADPTNLLSAFATAQDGDTIKVTGSFGHFALQNRSFKQRVILDATNATFTDTLTIQNVSGLFIVRGTFGSQTEALRTHRAVAIKNSSNVTFQHGTFIGNGSTAGVNASYGVTMVGSQAIHVYGGQMSNFRTGLTVASSRNVKLDNTSFVAMTSDGINISDSHFVTATANTCTGTVAYPGAHPDCIQLWSVLGNPPQSNISLVRNIANGATQGFTTFNAQDGGGIRISMIENIVTTSHPQGFACYSCVDSVFRNNVVSTLP